MQHLVQSDRRQLLELARAVVEATARRDPKPELDPHVLTPELLACAAAFVTLHKSGGLRGCIERGCVILELEHRRNPLFAMSRMKSW